MKLVEENLPASLLDQREPLTRCLRAMNHVMPLSAVYLFGSHARGEARPGSDVDLCVVAVDAQSQSEAMTRFAEAIWHIWPRPSLTIVPITPARLAEKQAVGDHFFKTVITEAVTLATKEALRCLASERLAYPRRALMYPGAIRDSI